MIRAVATVLVLLAAPALAAAHPRVDEARRRVAEADFDRAERAFTRAESARDFTRDDAIAFYEGRALLAHALHQEERMTADLRRLAALAPDHEFARGLPPEIPAAFARIQSAGGAPLGLDVETTREGDDLRIRASSRGDPGDLVRQVKLRARIGTGVWREARGSSSAELTLRAPEDALIEIRVIALGVGNATLLEETSEAGPDATAGADPDTDPATTSDRTPGTTTITSGGITITTGNGETRIEGVEGLEGLARLRELERGFVPEPEPTPEPQVQPARGAIPVRPVEPREEAGTRFTISGWAIVGIAVAVTAIAVGIYLAVTLPGDETMPSAPDIPGL